MKRDIGAALYYLKLIEKSKRICFAREQRRCGINTRLIKLMVHACINISLVFTGNYFNWWNQFLWNLVKDELIRTQITNEWINGVISKKCPNDIYDGGIIFEMGVDSAVINFNAIKSSAFYVTNVFCIKKDDSGNKVYNRNEGVSEKFEVNQKRVWR